MYSVIGEVHFGEDVTKLAMVTMALAQTRKTASEMASNSQTGLVWGPEAAEKRISLAARLGGREWS